MHTDPISDLLTRIRNAATVGHSQVEIFASKFKVAVVKVLHEEGYISSYELRLDPVRNLNVIRIYLKYDSAGKSVIRLIKRISKPGLRNYSGFDRLPKVLGGAGIAIVSTSAGLMTDRKARKQKLGGEVICYVH
jgi:small subunit ribosomal protein S8